MVIKQVLEYDYNYAEYIVTDGEYDLICMCLSVPLSENKAPQIGMLIENIFAFTLNDTIRLTISKNKNHFILKEKEYFKYKVCGNVVDSKRSLIRVFDFIISLEFYYPDGLPTIFKNTDCVEFEVDRFDCTILENN